MPPVKKGIKITFVYFEKTAIKDLQFSLWVFFFKYTNEKISLEASGLCANVSIPSGHFKALSILRILQTTHAANAERGESI